MSWLNSIKRVFTGQTEPDLAVVAETAAEDDDGLEALVASNPNLANFVKKAKKVKVTPDQRALMAECRDEWVKIGLSNAPANRDEFAHGIMLAYAAIGKKAPKIAWSNSPMKGVVAATILTEEPSITKELWDGLIEDARKAVDGHVKNTMVSEVKREIMDAVGNRMGCVAPLVACELVDRVAHLKMDGAERVVQEMVLGSCFGAHDSAWLAYYEFMWKVLGVDCSKLEGLMVVARAGGWFWPFETQVIACERPVRSVFDSEGRLHSGSDNAIEYPDAFGLCSWHGVRVPASAIHKPADVNWGDVEKTADKDLREALAEIKALKWSEAKAAPTEDAENSEHFEAALAAKRLGGVAAVRGLVESEETK